MSKLLKWGSKVAALIIGVSLGAALLGVPWILYLQRLLGDDVDLTIITRLPLEVWSLIAGLLVIAGLLRLESDRLRDAYFCRDGLLCHSFTGSLIGLFAAGLSTMVALWNGQVMVNTNFSPVPVYLLMALCLSVFLNALLQEMIFRGYVFRVSEKTYGTFFAIFASSIGFVLVHGGVYSGLEGFLSGVGLFFAGLGMAFMVLITRSIWLATGYHFGWNMAQSFLSDGVTNKAYVQGSPLVVDVNNLNGVNFEHAASGLAGPVIVSILAFLYWRFRQTQKLNA